MKEKKIIFKASEHLWRAIAQAALDRSITRSELIVKAIEKYLNERRIT